MANRILSSHVRVMSNAGPPLSGTSGTGVGDPRLEAGSVIEDTTNGVIYVNEGTAVSPYWTPAGLDQAPLFGVHTDFRDQAGKALANTAAEAIIPGSGLRIFGQGIEVNGDSGLVANAATEGGTTARLHATNETSHLAAIGMDAGVMQPDQHGKLTVDVEFTSVTNILTRAFFLGFAGTAADALDPVATGATVTLTLVQDDLAGILMDSRLTDAAGLMAAHNKSNEAATLLVAATGVDTGSDMPAAATFVRLRVEITAAGLMVCFKDKVQIASIAASLDADEEVSPVFYVETTTAATKAVDIRRFSAFAYR